MKLSFDDEDSLKEAVGSLCFNNPPSDPNTIDSMLAQDPETRKNEDISFNDPPGDPRSSSSIVEI